MSDYRQQLVPLLHNFATGAPVGVLGLDGREYLLPFSAAYATTPQAGTAYPGNFTTLTASSTVSGTGFSNYLASPPSIGTTTAGVVKTSDLRMNYTDSSSTPGNVTNNSPSGRAAFAAAASTVVVTSSLVTANSIVQCALETADGTLTQLLRVTPAAGSFTVVGNAAATGTPKFTFQVINQ